LRELKAEKKGKIRRKIAPKEGDALLNVKISSKKASHSARDLKARIRY